MQHVGILCTWYCHPTPTLHLWKMFKDRILGIPKHHWHDTLCWRPQSEFLGNRKSSVSTALSVICSPVHNDRARFHSQDNAIQEVLSLVVITLQKLEHISLQKHLLPSVNCLGIHLVQDLWKPKLSHTIEHTNRLERLLFVAFLQ